jgi:beta-glucuronidase
MKRLFAEHYIRKVTELDGIWQCHLLDSQNEGQRNVNTMVVPGCIENHPSCMQYRGRAKYTKNILAQGNIRLWFGGVSHTAKVYFDGQFVGEHYNAYTGFEIVIPDVERGEHILEVYTDNSFGLISALHVENDYYTYGGIIRPVQMEILDYCYIQNIHIDMEKKSGSWQIRQLVKIKNLSCKEKRICIQARLEGEVLHESGMIQISPNEEFTYEWKTCISDVEDYLPANPKLYMWEIRLGNETGEWIDDLLERSGFREIKIKENHIYLNGEKVKIKGVNRHEEYGDLGCCIPLDIMYRDIMLMKEMGVNFVRTSHYQNDERFLDLCDENGILVWEEGHARALDEEQMKNPYFMEQSKTGIREMIEYHYNHPSIIIWGILNECASHTEYGRTCYQQLFALIKELDQSRLTTFASCHDQDDICLDLPDILSFNIYPLWYLAEKPEDYLQRLHQYIRKQGKEGKPLLISEIGAGAIYGYRSLANEKWSEERQAEILEAQLQAVLADQECSGVCIWQFADCRVSEEWFYMRPNCRNNKGILNQYRHPKLAYEKVKEILSR